MNDNGKTDAMRKVPLFAQLSKRELEQVAALADEVEIPAGRVLMQEGDRGREFIVLLDGEADVERGGRHLRTLGRGDFLGEIALVSRVPRTATVTAKSDLRALVITDQGFRSLMASTPEIQAKVLDAFAERLEPTTL